MEPLHDVVLIKPQWLADVMKELMNIDQGDDKLKPEGDDMKKALHKFEKEGKADKTVSTMERVPQCIWGSVPADLSSTRGIWADSSSSTVSMLLCSL